MSKSKFAHLVLAVSLIACNKEHPKPQAKPQVPDKRDIQVSKPLREGAALPSPSQNRPQVGQDGSPLFDHFVGESCALSRSGETWCPVQATRHRHYYRLPTPEVAKQVMFDPSGISYVLGGSGQVYLFGEFKSDTDEHNSLRIEAPEPVTTLRKVKTFYKAYGYLALTSDGDVLQWQVNEVRDEDGLAVRLDVTRPQEILSKIDDLWAHSAVCVRQADVTKCTYDGDLRSGHWSTPKILQNFTPTLAYVSSTASCFSGGGRSVDCFAGWTAPGLGDVRMVGHFHFEVSAMKLSGEMLLDTKGKLFRFVTPALQSMGPDDVTRPALVPLRHLENVVDFEDQLCAILVDGTLRCRDDEHWATAPLLSVVFDPSTR